MNTLEIEELWLWSILTFLESAEDVGYDETKHGSVREWFTNKTLEEMSAIISNLMDIIEEENAEPSM